MSFLPSPLRQNLDKNQNLDIRNNPFHIQITLQKIPQRTPKEFLQNSQKILKKFQRNSKEIPKKFQRNSKKIQKNFKNSKRTPKEFPKNYPTSHLEAENPFGLVSFNYFPKLKIKKFNVFLRRVHQRK